MSRSASGLKLDGDVVTDELNGVRLVLADRLRFSLQSWSGGLSYVIEDPQNGTYFRIGTTEYTFLSLLDGRTTVAEAMARTAAVTGPKSFRDEDCIEICNWLISHQLASTPWAQSAEPLADRQEKQQNTNWLQKLNPLSITVQLGNPEPFLRWLQPVFGTLFRPLGFGMIVMLGLFTAWAVLSQWNRFTSGTTEVISRENWILFGLAWIGLKAIHEVSHGVACLAFGGSVRNWGVNFMLGVPLPFVNVSSSWSLASKWHRMAIGAAGMYAEFTVALLAALFWCRLSDGIGSQLCSMVMLTGGVLTVLFNLNPLMRFDGYYLLADWLEIPNLSQYGRADLLRQTRRWLFGVRLDAPVWPDRSWLNIRIYGVLSAAWRSLMTVSIIIGAESMFAGAGIILALLAFVLWILVPIVHAIRYVVHGLPGEQHSRFRFALITTCLMLLGAYSGSQWTVPERLVLPAIYDYSPLVNLRSSVPGFVRDVTVVNGQMVATGELVARLNNPDLEFQLADLQNAVFVSERRLDGLQATDEIAAVQHEQENLNALRLQLAEAEAQISQLEIRSPSDGVVIAAELDSLLGQFVTSGELLCQIGHPDARQIQTLVTAEQLFILQDRIGKKVEISLAGRRQKPFAGVLREIEPTATTQLRHPALAASAGGPIVVRSAGPLSSNNTNENQPGIDQHVEMLEPRFVATIQLTELSRESLGAGQLGNVYVQVAERTPAELAFIRSRDWLETHLRH
jgi:putative peptide zinc metalloprotease protein